MLQELPKKKKDYAHPTRAQMFWRTQAECLRRAITPCLMYVFMSMIALVMQTVSKGVVSWWSIALGIVCIVCGAVYNAHLCFHTGKKHYEVYLTGEFRRRNEAFGIESGGDYRAHEEFRVWKGFYIGLLTGLPVLIFGTVSAFTRAVDFVYLMFAGWAYLPLAWARQISGNLNINGAWTLFMLLLPIAVSGTFYLLGARKRRTEKEQADARAAEVERIREEQKQKRQERETRVQTEEQRRKTAQSKKKK